MKKLTALVALMLCVIIGGVYAVWTYAGNDLDHTQLEIGHALETATQEGSLGTLVIESSSLMVKIDQTAIGDYTAKLVITGEMIVRFTPSMGVSDDITNDGVPAHAYFSLSNIDENKYPDVNGIASPIYVIAGENSIAISWTKQSDGSFTTTITADQIDGILDLGATFVLNTIEEHTAFGEKEKLIDLDLYISQK